MKSDPARAPAFWLVLAAAAGTFAFGQRSGTSTSCSPRAPR